MAQRGSADRPVRVAIVGSGPAGFYAAESLLKRDEPRVEVDMFDRLPTPFGLVRFGVAPDHQKIKNVTRVFDKVARRPGFRFFGNVEIGSDLHVDELRECYDAICFATGAQTDRRMGIPGEDLARSHPATEFVAWFNGHPDYRDASFDLSAERVAVVGVGNVAVDVARILCRTPDELAATDIADYALEALAESRVRDVYMLGRRGPAQAAFTNPEVRELGEMEGADLRVLAEEVALDPLSQAALDREDDDTTRKKVEILQRFAEGEPAGKPKRLFLRFLVSPTELIAGPDGGVRGMRLVKNRLVEGGGRLRAEPTDATEALDVDLVFRSVGYHGVPVPGVPFHERWGIIPNDGGRVLDGEGGAPVPGLYVAGWIKRGPTGVIGTNKPDGAETAKAILEDVAEDRVLDPPAPSGASIEALVRERAPDVVTYEDWLALDALEVERGSAGGRPRVKFVSPEEVRTALGR